MSCSDRAVTKYDNCCSAIITPDQYMAVPSAASASISRIILPADQIPICVSQLPTEFYSSLIAILLRTCRCTACHLIGGDTNHQHGGFFLGPW
jgi:hypothetical protein